MNFGITIYIPIYNIMRSIFGVFLFLTTVFACEHEDNFDVKEVLDRFKDASGHLQRISYDAHRVDTIPIGDTIVLNFKGDVIIEKDTLDKVFGFSFYGKRHDLNTEYLYHNNLGFTIYRDSMEYEISNCHAKGFIGSPGGQMVASNIFYLDSIYETVELSTTKNTYVLTYTFRDNTEYNITDRSKKIELDKDSFLPVKISETSKRLGNKFTSQISLSHIKVEGVKPLNQFKNEIVNYEIVRTKEADNSDILNQTFQEISLVKLTDNREFTIPNGKLTLVDFWEVWCGPCIKSLPKLEALQSKYSDRLQIIGIVSEDKLNSARMLEKKGITFVNLFSSKELHERYGINSFPKYLLVDENGIIIRHYRGLNKNVELDIESALKKVNL